MLRVRVSRHDNINYKLIHTCIFYTFRQHTYGVKQLIPFLEIIVSGRMRAKGRSLSTLIFHFKNTPTNNTFSLEQGDSVSFFCGLIHTHIMPFLFHQYPYFVFYIVVKL